jgi:hypothetical protein
MTYHRHHALSGGTTTTSGAAKVSIPVSMTMAPPSPSSSWQTRVVSAAQAYYDALVRARAAMPTWTPGDAQITAASNLLSLAKRDVAGGNLAKFRAELQLAFAFAPKDASSAPVSRSPNVATATAARDAVIAAVAVLRDAIAADPTQVVVASRPTLPLLLTTATTSGSKTTPAPSPTTALVPATPPVVVATAPTAADQMIECTDGYVRDANGLCMPGAPAPITYPGVTMVATLSPPSSGLLGVSYKWWGLGAVGVALAGGAVVLSRRRRVAANRRRRRR